MGRFIKSIRVYVFLSSFTRILSFFTFSYIDVIFHSKKSYVEDERIRNREENLASLVRSNLCREGTNNVNFFILLQIFESGCVIT